MFIHFCWLQKRWTLVLRVRRLTCGMGENRKTGIEVLYPHSADKRVIRHHNSLSSRERNSSRPSYTAQHFRRRRIPKLRGVLRWKQDPIGRGRWWRAVFGPVIWWL